MLWKTPITIHPLGFAPDLPTNSDGRTIVITDMNGMYPTLAGVRMLPALISTAAALSGPALEAYLSRLPTGGFNLFAATQTHLYRFIPGAVVTTGTGWSYATFTSTYHQYQSLPHLTYGDPSFSPTVTVNSGAQWSEVDNGVTFMGSGWNFAQSGTDCLATNGADPVQVYGANSTFFAPLAGNPPVAKYITTVDPGAGTGVVTLLANLATDPTGWVASGPGSDTIWTLNVNDLSASGFLRSEPGPITGLKSVLTYAVAFKSNALYLGVYVGPPYIWNWQPISHQIGTLSNDSAIDIGSGLLVFVGPDDFYQFDGATITAIPNALKQWFFGTPGLPATGIANQDFLGTIQARYDATLSVVFWHFSSVSAQPSGALDMYVSWNRRTGRWGVGHQYIAAPVRDAYSSAGTTYSQFTALYRQYQSLPHVTYGSAIFQPAAVQAQALILTDNTLYTYTGTPISGYVQFGDLGFPGHLTQINGAFALFGIYPAVNGTGQRALLNVFSRPNLGDGFTARAQNVPLGSRSDFSFRSTDYWQQFQIQFLNDAELQAIVPDGRDAGTR